MGSIRRASQLIEEINGAMHEQSNGIGQISQAVAEMDRSTQQNAALVEEAAAAASVLNDQAHHLAQVVGAFKLGDTGPQATTQALPGTAGRPQPRLH